MTFNKKTKEDSQLLDDIASILAVQNSQDKSMNFQQENNKTIVENLSSDFSDILDLQNDIISVLENGNDDVDSLILDIDSILNSDKPIYNKNNVNIIEKVNVGSNWNELVANNRQFASKHSINLDNPYTAMFSNSELTYFNRKMIEKFDICELDKYDYAFAAASGLITGIIDVCLVGTITADGSDSILQNKVDGVYDKIVTKYAKLEKTALLKSNEKAALKSNPQDAAKIKEKFKKLIADVDSMDKKNAVSFLENNHRVNYDVATSFIEQNGKKVLEGLNPSNHHLFSLSHDPGIIGLIFGIIDQLTGKASIIDPTTGKLVRKATDNLQKDLGLNPVEKIVKAVSNWLGHVMSDIAGSSTSKGRGAGLPVPGWEALQKLHFGQIPVNGKEMDFAQMTEWMYKNGFDIRSFTAQAIPVVINECLVRIYWFIKQKFYFGKDFKESLPIANNREVTRLLLVATATFSGTDLIHAVVKSGGLTDISTFIMTINIPGLADLGIRSFQNIRFEVQHRHFVEDIIDNDIATEWQRILSE